jgi:hypothetical protein
MSHSTGPFCVEYFCLSWLQTVILLISASWVTRITGMSYWWNLNSCILEHVSGRWSPKGHWHIYMSRGDGRHKDVHCCAWLALTSSAYTAQVHRNPLFPSCVQFSKTQGKKCKVTMWHLPLGKRGESSPRSYMWYTETVPSAEEGSCLLRRKQRGTLSDPFSPSYSPSLANQAPWKWQEGKFPHH